MGLDKSCDWYFFPKTETTCINTILSYLQKGAEFILNSLFTRKTCKPYSVHLSGFSLKQPHYTWNKTQLSRM